MSAQRQRRGLLALAAIVLAIAVGLSFLALSEPGAAPPSERLTSTTGHEALQAPSSAIQRLQAGAQPRGDHGALALPRAAISEHISGVPRVLTAPPMGPDPDGGAPATVSCVLDSDCPATFACLGEGPARERRCVPADCEEDADCPTGFVCRRANFAASAGQPILRCMVVGDRRRGEACSFAPESRDQACAEGLLCNLFTCGAPCTLGGVDAGCSEGERCLNLSGGNGAACYTPCTKTSCPTGKTCVVISRDGLARCSEIVGTDCHDTPCPPGQECLTHFTETKAHFECLSQCNPLVGPACPPGFVCGAGVGAQSYCYESCAPDAGEAAGCPSGKRCVPVSEDEQLFGCRAR